MKIAFRTDASTWIGSGHLMRCATLAHRLQCQGAEIHFLCRRMPGDYCNWLAQKGFTVHGLTVTQAALPIASDQQSAHITWLGVPPEQEIEESLAVLVEHGPFDWLIVDHYALDARWEKTMRPHFGKIMVIDDLADRPHDCDLLLDQNLVADMGHRYDGKVPEYCGLMLGPDYAMLQPQYTELHPRVPPREGHISRVLVYFGGSDADNLTCRSIVAFLSLGREDATLDVVINPADPHAASIRQQVEGQARIMLCEGVPSLAPLMVKADLAIGAGGATSWERCCLGLPALVITLAENQRPIAAELDRQGLIRWLGHKNEVSEATLAQAMKDIFDSGILPDWSENCQHLVDGRGAGRVASILMLNAQTPLKTRLARLDDEGLILQWANDSLVRQNALSSGTIDHATHRAWFRKRLRDLDNCRLYVVETDDGFPVGQVHFERSGETWEIDYALDARACGRRLGKPLLQTAMLDLRASTNGALLFGRVKDSNGASRRIFEALGFESEKLGGGLSIAICSGAGSWINASVPELVLGWLGDGHSVAWVHAASDLPGGDLCFYLSYGRIVDAPTRGRYNNNLVVHESDLPKGRGWSPMSWLILEGADRIPVTLLEAVDELDAGLIYLQEWIELEGHELSPEWRALQADSTRRLCRQFVAHYPVILDKARKQTGEPTFYPRRRPKDSELDPTKRIVDQFNLLRIVDSENYPAFLDVSGKKIVLRIERSQKKDIVHE